MKKVLFVLMMSFGVLGFAQKSDHYHKKEHSEREKFAKDFERMIELEKEKFKKEFKNISVEEKRDFFRRVQVQRLMEELNLSSEKKVKVQKLFEEYFERRDEIMRKFRPDFDEKNFTEEQALEQITKGLNVAQELLDMRVKYAHEFLKELTAKQVLEVNKIEKEMMNHLRKYKERK